MAANEPPKFKRIYDDLHAAIVKGEYAVGQRVPTEAQISARYGASRPTVARALRELEQRGYLVRRRGVGSFVKERPPATERLFAMIVPRPGEGIFAAMTSAIVREAEAQGYGLLLAGSLMAGRGVALPAEEAFCEQITARKVAGVFFGPLDVQPEQWWANTEIAERIERAGIPIVLLDRDIVDYPARSRFDLIGVNNRRESRLITEHLLNQGCRRIEYVVHDWIASTSSARIEGFKDAMAARAIAVEPAHIHRWDMNDRSFAQNLLRNPLPDAFVCVNDLIAAALMHNLAVLGVRVPEDVRLVGFDDIEIAGRLPTPLTTMRQPARDLGTLAVRAMLDRLANPDLPARETTLACRLIVRESCGAQRCAAMSAAG